MIHPLLRLVASQPQLVAEHAHAYAELFGEDLGKTAATLKWQALFGIAALVLGSAAAVLAGVALMLWGVSPPGAVHAAWALFAAPLLPASLAAWCILAARRAADAPFETLKQQLAADMSMLREAGAV